MPPSRNSLKLVDSHFKFGQNWARYAELLDAPRIAQATADLQAFLGRPRLDGLRFLDIGCGSGVHSLAALRLGAAHVTAIDIDADSVATTTRVLQQAAPAGSYVCRELSIFDARPAELGRFDVVYSWGVLHHTGAMYEAIARAAEFVAVDGLLALALYRRTVLCRLWKIEKRIYSRLPGWLQRAAIELYTLKTRLGFMLRGRSFRQYLDTYSQQRGMRYEHDVHDWLGGYPYESLTPRAFSAYVESLGFQRESPAAVSARALWTLSSGGCQEIRFRRAA